MTFSWERRSVRLTVLGGGVGLFVFVCGTAILPRGMYYLQRANYQGTLQKAHLSRIPEYQRRLADPERSDDDDWLYLIEDNARLASRHSRLRKLYRRAAFALWESPSDELPLPYPWNQDRDRRVLEAVLLRTTDGATSADASHGDRKHATASIVVNKVITIGRFESWYRDEILEPLGLSIDLAEDLQLRNREGSIPLTEFEFQSKRIVIDDLDRKGREAEARYPDAARFVHVSLPGYSRDGKAALVAVSDSLSEHFSGAVYILTLLNGEWHIALEDRSHGE
jgi:hypothetical protein